MTTQLVHGPNRLALRIYLVTVAALLATALALYVIVKVAWGPPPHERFPGFARYAAAQLAGRWGSPDAVREEVSLLRSHARLAATVYRWDDGLVASGGPAAASPLSPGEREALSRGETVERGRPEGPGPPVHAIAIANAGENVGYVVLAPADPPRGRPPPPELLPAVLVLVALGVAAALLGSAIARPLDRLAATARRLGSGDLSARTGIARRDELGAVARAFDDMADRIVALLRAQTELIANVAHELRTPLARIGVAIDLAQDGDPAVARESLAEIATDLGELERLVSDILASARMDLAQSTTTGDGAPPLRRRRLAIEEVVDGAVQRLGQLYPARRVEVEVEPGLPQVDGDEVLLRRVLHNLLDNARKYSPPASAIQVRALRRGGEILVQVVDRGEGMSEEEQRQLFTPFFRADRSRARATGGVGLGLVLARRIVEAHGGTITVESAPGAGTTVGVALPAVG